ncbi:phosphodiesterase/alkaline phosphatase D [Fictibacillus macauensis ZFHKF-1]|uniref:Phosphodiesterase/alkaline phosphatase D n=1 Tax=Fictibacillus macauensis ZFHKF-1 TaxID=1196324 RepID=I8AKS5_9BACL|nr:alkaline phosphatase [Fictibacillus macauensis]EIT86442.1 phosphodiesterase/alkaline phosphatase D [Fictibacillus macauensis ZFHKF-1]
MPMEDWMKSLKEKSENGIPFDRRAFLKGSGKVAGLSLALLLAQSIPSLKVNAAIKFRSYPFTLGVASGDPLSDSVVLWTRLAPDPLNGGGMGKASVPVTWEVAKDEAFRHVVQKGTALATPHLGHSVHVEVSGLEAHKTYYYRFQAGHELSPIGRTKTLPKEDARVSSLTFAFASCQQYEHGYYTAYHHMAKEKLDFVLHLGDYIYEYGPNEYISPTGNIRTHHSEEVMTLTDYRNRYAQYRSDAHLKEAHAAFPWIVTWDDHEVENNYANTIPEKGQAVDAFIERRQAAYQAYYEHMPLRLSTLPQGPDMQLYRSFQYGTLAAFNVLDTRQYRDDQANGDGNKPPSQESMDPKRTLLGEKQEQWLLNELQRSHANWNVMAQQIFFSQWNFGTTQAPVYSMDSWDGYPAQRQRIIDTIAKKKLNNVIVLSGDVHASWANNLLLDFNKASSPIFGAEFVGTSITSGGNGADQRKDTDAILQQNPHIKFFNDYRGYVRCKVTEHQWQSDYRVLPFVTEPGAAISTRASFIYKKDQTGLKKVSSMTIDGGRKQSSLVEQDRLTAHKKAIQKQQQKHLEITR